MGKLPSFQFYPGDWRKDHNLSRASKAAKGVFMDIMCIAFECEKRGILKTGKKPWSIEEIAYAVGGDISENIKCIEELLTLKVLKIDRKNTIFQSRIVHDEKIRKIRAGAGSKGGNPILLNQTSKQKSTPSSSSSSSSSIDILNKVVDGDPFFKMFRGATGSQITDEELILEVGKFKNKYPNIHANQAGALINNWISKIGNPIPQKPKMIL